MKVLTPRIITEVTGGRYFGEDSDRDISVVGAVSDNRNVEEGNLFVCIQGARVDGHSFANNAFDAGAACCLAEKDIADAKGPYVLVDSASDALIILGTYYRSLFNIPVIGITGSVGKTTAKELIAAVLSVKYNVLKTKGNFNTEIGVPLTLLSLNDRHEIAVIEMGIRNFGDMDILAKIVRPDIFVMTKIGYSHIKELGDLQGVLRAKTEAFAHMKSDGIAVMNGDDELLSGYNTGLRTLKFGYEKHNDVRVENVVYDNFDFMEFDIVDDLKRFSVHLPAYGVHLTALAPAAVITGRLSGMSDEEIREGFLTYVPVEGRSNVVKSDNFTLIDDCYNANPNSVKSALISISLLPGHHIAILGDMFNLGEHSKQLHYDTGVFAATSGIAGLICLGDHALEIYNGYVSAGGSEAFYYTSIDELAEDIPLKIKKGDVILLKASRGMYFEKLLPVIYGFQPNERKT